MATSTPNYSLQLYEDTDKPNLRDQYNNSMRTLDTKLLDFDGKITQNANSISQLQSDLNDTKDDVEGISTRLTAAEGSIKSIQSELDGVYDNMPHQGQLVVFGDSFSDTTQRAYSWPNLVKQYEVVNMAVSGASFTNSTNTIMDQVNSYIARKDDKAKVAACVVYAGYNDYQIGATFTTIAPAVTNVYNKLCEHFKGYGVKIVMCLFNNSYAGDIDADKMRTILAGFPSVMSSVPYVNAFNWTYGWSKANFPDGTHPDATIQGVICENIMACINGTYDPNRVHKTYNVESGSGGNACTMYIDFCDGCYYPKIRGLRYIGALATGQHQVDLGGTLTGKDCTNPFGQIVPLHGIASFQQFLCCFINTGVSNSNAFTIALNGQITGDNNIYFGDM